VDYLVYRAINGLSGWPVADEVMRIVANDLAFVIAALVALLFCVPWPNRRLERRYGAVASVAAAGISLAFNQPLSQLVDRTRPYIAHPTHAHLLIARSTDPSLPSDHATGAFAIAVAVSAYDRVAATVFFVLAVLVSFARIYVGTHYPFDVVAGALIGTAFACVLRVPFVKSRLESLTRTLSNLWDRATAVALGRGQSTN
jgi:undecaprenyl-diphosphatase